MKTPILLLGGLSPQQFLRDYWQKKPLLIRAAVPDFKGLLSPGELIELACQEDAQARLITQSGKQFDLQHGPFVADEFSQLGKRKWTVLVQGINHHLPAAADLLAQFNFIPHARLDDLMVSYAPAGGGVGPHFDSYDVFLLQGAGQRRWQISAQANQTLVKGAPLRILQNFQAEQEWLLNPGDMLYLPPQYAHNGIAENDCMTYSIGFRAPSFQELAEQFLVYLQDRIQLPGRYADPDLQVPKHASEISEPMLDQVELALKKVCWDRDDIANFLGCYLSEPKAHIVFDAPARAISAAKFQLGAQKFGIVLDLKTQMLCHANTVFINAETYPVTAANYPLLRELASHRKLAAIASPDICAMLYEWYLDGYLTLSKQ